MKVKLSKEPSFKQDGLNGYTYPLQHTEMQVNFIDCYEKHENYCSYARTFVYYIVDGKGQYKINNDLVDVEKGDLIEIPPNTKFTYKGKMKVLLIIKDGFDRALSESFEKTDI